MQKTLQFYSEQKTETIGLTELSAPGCSLVLPNHLSFSTATRENPQIIS